MAHYRRVGRSAAELLESRLLLAGGAAVQSAGDGLRATYYNGNNFTGSWITRIDPAINFDWSKGSPGTGVNINDFTVRWRGQIEPRYTETYTFNTRTDDGARLWIDGKLLIDNWIEATATKDAYASVALVAGEKYDLVMEYIEIGGNASAKLLWSSGSQLNEIVPQSQLYSTPALPAPADLKASAQSTSQIALNWRENAVHEQGFKVERATNGGPFAAIETLSADSTSFSDSGLNEGTSYSYRVRAYSNSADGAYSTVASATTLTLPPAAPSGLTALATSSSAVQLSWIDHSNNETGFKIARSVGGGVFQQIASVGRDVTQFTDSNLAEDTSYVYRISATNVGGDSAASNTASVKTALNIPVAAGGLRVVATSASSTELTWIDRSSNESGFKIERSLDGGAFAEVATVGRDVTSLIDTGLDEGSAYSYRVCATNRAGDSGFSNVASAETPLSPPSALHAQSNGLNITLNWVDGSQKEDGFAIQISSDGSNFTDVATVGRNVTTFTDSGLDEATAYEFRVKAYGNGGNSAFVAVTQMTGVQSPFGGSPIALPGMIEAEEYDNGGDGVSYLDLTPGNSGNDLRRADDVDVGLTSDSGGGAYVGWSRAGERLEYTVAVADSGQYRLEARVASAVAGGRFRVLSGSEDLTGAMQIPATGGWQRWVTISKTVSLSAGPHVLRVAFEANGATGYVGNLNWLRLTRVLPAIDQLMLVDADSDTDIGQLRDDDVLDLNVLGSHHLSIRADANTATESVLFDLDGRKKIENIAPFALAGDIGGVDYLPWAASVGVHDLLVTPYSQDKAVGQAGDSVSLRFTVIDSSISLTAPLNLTATPRGPSAVDLAWVDNSRGEVGFSIEQSTDGVDWTAIATARANAESYSVADLKAGTAYQFRVRSYSASSQSGFSNIASATTAKLVKPNATNTGPNNAAALVGLPVRAPAPGATITAPGTYGGFEYSGDIEINADNVILENFVLRDGSINIGDQKNVTIRNFRMFGSGAIGSYTAKDVTIENGEISVTASSAIWGCGRGLTCRYLYIHDVAGDVFRPFYGDLTIEYCFVDEIGVPITGEKHADVLQAWNMDGMVIRYNNFNAGLGGSGVLTVYDNNRNALIENNWFDGAGYAFSVDSKAGGKNIVRHNRWGRGSRFGAVYPTVQTYEIWEDNTFEDNGQPIGHA